MRAPAPPARSPQGYVAAGQYDAALDAVRWGTDYLMKCVGDDSIVASVGNGNQDHGEPSGKRVGD